MSKLRNKYLQKIADIASGPLVEDPVNKLGSVTEKDKFGRLGSFFVNSTNKELDVVNSDTGNYQQT